MGPNPFGISHGRRIQIRTWNKHKRVVDADAGVSVILTGITMWRQAILVSTTERPARRHTAEQDMETWGWRLRAAHRRLLHTAAPC